MPYRNEIPRKHICRLPAAWQAAEDYSAGTEWVCDHCDKAWVLNFSTLNKVHEWKALFYEYDDEEPDYEPQVCGVPHPSAKWFCHREQGHDNAHWCKMGMGGEVEWESTWTDDGYNEVLPPNEEIAPWVDPPYDMVCNEVSIPSGATCYLPEGHEGLHHDVLGNEVVSWQSGEYEEKRRIHGHEEAPA